MIEKVGLIDTNIHIALVWNFHLGWRNL